MALLFFDIDGTLWDRQNVIPDSTKMALKCLKENGHQIFICSGRTRVFMRSEELFSLGFDGCLSGCGTNIEYHGEELLYKELDRALLARSVQLFYAYDLAMVMEGRDRLYMDADMIGKDEYGRYLLEVMKDYIQPVRDNEKNWQASKFSLLIRDRNYRPVIEALRDDYEFLIHGTVVMEAVPRGYSKATAIALMCEKTGVARADTFAFGDGVNDLEMLDFSGTGVCMGNGAAIAKEHADYVTTDIHEDGIFKACRHFGLI